MVVPTGARDWGWRFESADRAYYVPPPAVAGHALAWTSYFEG